MVLPGFVIRHRLLCIALFDICVAVIFAYCIPLYGRPFDALLICVAVVGVINTVVSNNGLFQNVVLILVALALSLFALEMLQRKYNILDMPLTANWAESQDHKYKWKIRDTASYLAAIIKAQNDGMEFFAPTEFNEAAMLAGIPVESRMVQVHDDSSWRITTIANKPQHRPSATLGYELNPGLRSWLTLVVRDEPEKEVLQCGYGVNQHGFRRTKGNVHAEEAYVFLGCSFTFGLYCNDDQTLAHYFSEAGDFSHNVLNLGVNGYGPNQSLYDIANDYHTGLSIPKEAKVRGVYFTLIDHHVMRISPPIFDQAPQYVLENGTLQYKGSYPFFEQEGKKTRLQRILASSRLYTPIHDRVLGVLSDENMEYRWDLAIAMLVEMDRVCRTRYGIPLTVVYWDEDPEVIGKIRKQGLDVIPVSEVFGENWRRDFIKYSLFDYHPTPYANKILGEYLYARN